MPNLTSVTVTNGVPTAGSGTVSTLDALMADGGQVTVGAKADAAVTNPASSGSLIALIKGILTGVNAATPAGTNNIGVITPLDLSAANGTTSSAATMFSIDTTGYRSISLQIPSIGSMTVSFEGSNDNSSWTAVSAQHQTNVGYTPAQTTTLVGVYIIPCSTRYFRARVSSYSSGTVTWSYAMRAAPAPGMLSAIVANNVPVNLFPLTYAGGGTSLKRVAAAASTNATSVKASTGLLMSFTLTNTTASAKFFKLYDKATSPTVGTDTPVATFSIQANGAVAFTDPYGVGFTNGIAFAITGAVGDSDTTAVSANDVHGFISYK